MDDVELPVKSGKSPYRAMQRAVGIPPRLDHAMMLVAGGATQKVAAKAAGISPSRLCTFLRDERGQSRMNFWVGQELRALAPKAVRTLDRNLGSKNAIASVRAAEGILDRSGLDGDGIRVSGANLIVHFDISPRHENETSGPADFSGVIDGELAEP